MWTRVCTKCLAVEGGAIPFSPGKGTYCMPCRREYSKKHYHANKSVYIEKGKKLQAELYVFLNQIKEATPCADCFKYYPPECMDFDHRDAGTKRDCVARLIKHNSKRLLIEEMAKCDLVCANCHRTRTKKRRIGAVD